MLLLPFAAALGLAGSPATTARAHHIDVQLIASTTSPRPGSTFLVGFRMTPQPGWHGYWSNPGESGLAPTVRWTAPPSVHFGPLQHPAPTLMKTMGLVSFVHSGEHVLVSPVRVDRGVRRGMALPAAAELSWAACSENLCVPEHATLTLSLTGGDGTPSPDADALRRAVAKEPARLSSGILTISGKLLVLQLPTEARLRATSARFYPDTNDNFEASRATVRPGVPLEIVAPMKGTAPQSISGVVADGAVAYRLTFRQGEPVKVAAAAGEATNVRPKATQQQPLQARPAATVNRTSDDRSAPYPWLRQALVVLALLGVATAAAALARRARR